MLNGKWSISSIMVVDGDGVLELDKNVKNMKFLLELEVSLMEHAEENQKDYKLNTVTYEVFNLSHTRSFLSELAVKDYSFGS